MSFGWLSWSNPVAVWWAFLVAVSAANVALWSCSIAGFAPDRSIFSSAFSALS